MNGLISRIAKAAAVVGLLFGMTAQVQAAPWQEGFEIVGSLALAGEAQNVIVRDDYAYVLQRPGDWFDVVDIGDPAHPRVVATQVVFRWNHGFAASDSLLIAYNHENVEIFDISNPTVPRFLDSEFFLRIESAGLSERNLLVSGIRVIEVPGDDPRLETGTFVYTIDGQGKLNFVKIITQSELLFREVEGDRLIGYLTSPFVYGVFDPQTESINLSEKIDSDSFVDLLLDGDRLTLLSGSAQVQQIQNLSQKPFILPTVNLPADRIGESVVPSKRLRLLAGSHPLYFVALGRFGIWALNLQDPFTFTPYSGYMLTPGPALGLAVKNDLVVAACGERGLMILRHTGPGGPIALKNFQLGHNARNPTFEVQTNLDIAGSAITLEVWRGSDRVKTLGEYWNAGGTFNLAADLADLPAGDGYRIRILSNWNPALYVETIPFLIP